jgi:hypothetical protein
MRLQHLGQQNLHLPKHKVIIEEKKYFFFSVSHIQEYPLRGYKREREYESSQKITHQY